MVLYMRVRLFCGFLVIFVWPLNYVNMLLIQNPDSQVVLVVNLLANTGDKRNTGLIPGLGRSPVKGNGNPLQYSCLGNPIDRGAWWVTVHGVTKSQTQLKWLSMHTQAAIQNHNNSKYIYRLLVGGICFQWARKCNPSLNFSLRHSPLWSISSIRYFFPLQLNTAIHLRMPRAAGSLSKLVSLNCLSKSNQKVNYVCFWTSVGIRVNWSI